MPSFRQLAVQSFCVIGLSISPASAGQVDDLYHSLTGRCWSCEAYSQITEVSLDLAEQVFAAVSGDVRGLLGLLMAIWLLAFAGRSLLPFGPSDPSGKLWNEGAGKILKFALALACLQVSQPLWDYVFMPLVALGAGYSVRLISLGQSLTCAVGPVASGVAGAKAAMGWMTCPLAGMQDVFSKGMLAGVAVTLGGGWHNWLDVINILGWPGRVIQIASGLLLALVYAFAFLTFPVCFLDTLLRAVITAVLAPLAVAAGLFAPTRRFAKKALWSLAQSALTMVFAVPVVGLLTATLDRVLTGVGGGDPSKPIDWSTLVDQLESGKAKLSILDQSYWALLAAGVMAIFMIRQAASMAAQFTGASSGDFTGAAAGAGTLAGEASRLGGSSAQTMVKGTTKLASLARRPAGRAARRVAKNEAGASGTTAQSRG